MQVVTCIKLRSARECSTCVVATALNIRCTPTRSLPDLQYSLLLLMISDKGINLAQPRASEGTKRYLADYNHQGYVHSACLLGTAALLLSFFDDRGNWSSVIMNPHLILDRISWRFRYGIEEDGRVIRCLPILESYTPVHKLLRTQSRATGELRLSLTKSDFRL